MSEVISKVVKDITIDGIVWITVRDAADLIDSTTATIYNQVYDSVIGKLKIGKSVMLVSKEDTLEYGKHKKTYYNNFENSND